MSKTIPKAYQFRFYLQDDLKIILTKTFGKSSPTHKLHCVRFVYNKTLDYSKKHYAQKETLESLGLEYKSLIGNDRDENACLNLFNLNINLNLNNHAAGTAVNACRGKYLNLSRRLEVVFL